MEIFVTCKIFTDKSGNDFFRDLLTQIPAIICSYCNFFVHALSKSRFCSFCACNPPKMVNMRAQC